MLLEFCYVAGIQLLMIFLLNKEYIDGKEQIAVKW